MSAALLLAEPEPSARSSLSRHLSSDGFAVHDATDGDEALTAVERVRPDLVLLGGGPGGTPVHEVCSRLRRGEPGRSWNRDVPVIVLGRDGAKPGDRVLAFERGCDDYMPRPFVYEELVARIRAVLRRARREPEALLVAGEVTVDRPTRTVRVAGRRVDLSAKEYELLLELASDPRRVFTRSELLQNVWRYPASCRTRTIDSHASRLRRKLEAGGSGPFVANVWGVVRRTRRRSRHLAGIRSQQALSGSSLVGIGLAAEAAFRPFGHGSGTTEARVTGGLAGGDPIAQAAKRPGPSLDLARAIRGRRAGTRPAPLQARTSLSRRNAVLLWSGQTPEERAVRQWRTGEPRAHPHCWY